MYVAIVGSPHPQRFIYHKTLVGKPTYNLNLQTSHYLKTFLYGEDNGKISER